MNNTPTFAESGNSISLLTTQEKAVCTQFQKTRIMFSLFIDLDLVERITESTNIKNEMNLERNKNDRSMYTTDKEETKAVIVLCILAESVNSGHQNLAELCNVDNMGIEIFYCTLNLKRFQFLLRNMGLDVTKVDR